MQRGEYFSTQRVWGIFSISSFSKHICKFFFFFLVTFLSDSSSCILTTDDAHFKVFTEDRRFRKKQRDRAQAKPKNEAIKTLRN